jgi:hypothetical protein
MLQSGSDNQKKNACDGGLSSICEALGLTHLTTDACRVSLSESMDTFAASGKTGLLAKLAQDLPLAKLPERQKIAIAVSKQKRIAPPPEPLDGPPRILFLHGYGTCPELMGGAVAGLKQALPGCHVELARGFITIDHQHPPTAAAFRDPKNAGLERIAAWAARTGKSLHCWANVRAAHEPERRQRPRNFNAYTDDEGFVHDYAWDAPGMAESVSKYLARAHTVPALSTALVHSSHCGVRPLVQVARACQRG